METKFTKGKWKVVHRDEREPDELDFMVMASGTPTGNARIAEVIREGNANLIAAAPNLYAALEAMEKHFGILGEEDSGINQTAIKVTKDARAALKKARGEA